MILVQNNVFGVKFAENCWGGFSRLRGHFRLVIENRSDRMLTEVGSVTFGRQVLATLMVLCGLAVFDLGSRAQAAFSNNIVAPESWSSGSATSIEHTSLPSWPMTEGAQLCFAKFLVAYTNFGSGGAGNPPTTSSTSGPSSVPALGSLNFLPDYDHISNDSVRTMVRRTGLSSLLVSIFEPPRSSVDPLIPCILS
jgi:hypothetical protein